MGYISHVLETLVVIPTAKTISEVLAIKVVPEGAIGTMPLPNYLSGKS